jgi:hypothetical protein
VIGNIDEYPDSESARQAVGGLIKKINAANPRICFRATTLAELSDHFERIELAMGNTWRSYSTKQCYAGYLKRWIVPQWGPFDLWNIKTIEVESWLRRLPLAKSSCAKIRGIMSVLFNHACRHELFDRNPIQLVRQGAKRKKTPCVLTPTAKTTEVVEDRRFCGSDCGSENVRHFTRVPIWVRAIIASKRPRGVTLVIFTLSSSIDRRCLSPHSAIALRSSNTAYPRGFTREYSTLGTLPANSVRITSPSFAI